MIGRRTRNSPERHGARGAVAAVGGLLIVGTVIAALLVTDPWEGGGNATGVTRAPATQQLPLGERRRHRFPWVRHSDDPLPPSLPPIPEPAVQAARQLGKCCSEGRQEMPIDAIVVHATELPDERGLGETRRLVRVFRRDQTGAHVADDASGNSSRFVPDELMAYHATYWNATTLGIEQSGASSFTREQWLARPAELEATAQWIAHWARLYRIPIRRCEVTGIRYNRIDRVVAGVLVRRGVCTHAQLDPRNRDDPGAGYPLDRVLARASALGR